MEFDRRYGKNCSDKDLENERLKRAVSIRYFVVKNHNKKGLESSFDQSPKATVTETKHTVSDGRKVYHKKDIADVTQIVLNNPSLLQGKLTVETKFKKIGRTKGGKFAERGDPGVESDEVPVVAQKKKKTTANQPIDLTEDTPPNVNMPIPVSPGFTSSEAESTEASETAPLAHYRRTPSAQTNNETAVEAGPTNTSVNNQRSPTPSPTPTVVIRPTPPPPPPIICHTALRNLQQTTHCLHELKCQNRQPRSWYGPVPYT